MMGGLSFSRCLDTRISSIVSNYFKIIIKDLARCELGVNLLTKRKAVLIPLLLLLIPLALSNVTVEAHAQTTPAMNVAVSVTSLAGITREVSGSHCSTTILMEQEADPHAFTLTPEIIAAAEQADLLVFTGHFHWEEDLANQTSTPFITFHDELALESYEEFGAEFSPMPGGELEGHEEHDEEDEHDHEGNPHGFWLLPENAIAIANATRSALTTLNDTLAGEWTSNFDLFVESVQEFQDKIYTLDAIYHFSDMHAVVAFPAEAYVAQTFGISADAVLQVEELTISGAQLYEVQQAIRNGSIDLIIGSDVARLLASGEFAYQLQADYGGILIWWKTVFFAESNYIWMMDYNLATLIDGIEEGPLEISDNTLNIGLAALAGVLGVLVAIETTLLVIRARAE
jgi:zinc/manganese transport system substrate-binding protein